MKARGQDAICANNMQVSGRTHLPCQILSGFHDKLQMKPAVSRVQCDTLIAAPRLAHANAGTGRSKVDLVPPSSGHPARKFACTNRSEVNLQLPAPAALQATPTPMLARLAHADRFHHMASWCEATCSIHKTSLETASASARNAMDLMRRQCPAGLPDLPMLARRVPCRILHLAGHEAHS